MKIGAAQTRPISEELDANITKHRHFVESAAAGGVDFLVFPELSLTGYEPTLAKELAIDPTDRRLDDFQKLSDAHEMSIGAGVPTRNTRGVCITMMVFQPHTPRYAYSKNYLHADEEPYFTAVENSPCLKINRTNVALAICYEISVAEHLRAALECNPEVYVASVAKFTKNINEARTRLTSIAVNCSIPVVMANCVGFSDGQQCAGTSCVWNDRGEMLGQLNGEDEGLLVFDTETQRVDESVYRSRV
jgi:predicted amidohydrolase